MKKSEDSSKMANKVESTEQEIESLNTLHDIITIYLGSQIIPTFKTKKIEIYQKIIQ